MTPKLKHAAVVLGLACLPMKAFATGGLGCQIQDKNLDFAYEALFSDSGNGPLFQATGSFESKSPKTAKSLRMLDANSLRLIQQWFEGKDLRLQFYAETDGKPFAAVKLTIETVMDEDEVTYNGIYRLEISSEVAEGSEDEPLKLEGKVACSAG